MNEEEAINTFLSTFKELEEELVKIAGLKENYTSFSRALNYIHNNNLDPFVSSDNVYEFLKTASDLRNILSHRNNVALPTEDFLNKFLKIADNIIHPTLCIDIATKGNDIIIGRESDKLLYLMYLMDRKYISHIPIYTDDYKFLGVFSRTTLYEYFLSKKSINFDENTRVSEAKEFIDISKHGNEKYLFVNRYAKIVDVYKQLLKKTKEDRKLSCIFITPNGKMNEKLLGIVTQVDILKLAAEIE